MSTLVHSLDQASLPPNSHAHIQCIHTCFYTHCFTLPTSIPTREKTSCRWTPLSRRAPPLSDR